MVNSRFKFRAWDKNRKKMWSHSDLYKMDCSNEYPFLALIRGFYATNMFPGEEMDVIPMQYTGLKDRNGKEIYEGDIVETDCGKGVVVFDSGSFLINILEDDEYYGFEDFFSLHEEGCCYLVEVIGNIFQGEDYRKEV